MVVSVPEVAIRAGAAGPLGGSLRIPGDARGLVVFAHGTGSSRFSPRNQAVADALVGAGLGTLLLDLLTADEEEAERLTRHLRFDVGLLAGRLEAAIDWTRAEHALPVGLFGASTGAAAALVAAARRADAVRAIVSRGGRPDLAGDALERVEAPTLLVVGGADSAVLELNRRALDRLGERGELRIVPGASHLFAESGALEAVADLARDWFLAHLPGGA